MTVHHLDTACTACGAIVHSPSGCRPRHIGQVTLLRCPACGDPAAYVSGTDRYYHLSGQPNRPCWIDCTAGRTDASIHRHNDHVLAHRPKRRGSVA